MTTDTFDIPSDADAQRLIDAHLDGELTPDDAARLEAWLAADPDHRRRFVRATFIHRQVRDLTSAGRLDAVDHAAGDADAPIVEPEEPTVLARLVGDARVRWAAAAVVVVAAALVVIIANGSGAALDPGERQAQVPVAGLLMGAADVTWTQAAGDGVPEVGSVLPMGTLAFDAGTIEIEFYSGARATIEGPASLTLDSTNGLTMRQGRLSAAVPAGAEGFTVATPTMRVVDLGTEFGVVAGWGAEDEVHVFDGAVSMTVGGRTDRITAGLGRAVASGGAVRTITADGFAFNRPEPIVPPAYRRWVDYRNAIRTDPSLVLYYTFQGQRPGDASTEDHSGRGHTGEMSAVALTDGRIPGKPAVRFTGPDSRVRFHVPGEFESLTAVAWVNFDTLRHRFNSIMHTDGWDQSEPHWIVGEYGDLYFNIRNVNYKLGTEQADVRPGDVTGAWRMMVGVFDRKAAAVSFYIDGREVFTSKAAADLPLVFDWCEIGNWRRPGQPDQRWLDGRIDEFALFDRALTPGEIRELYEMGKP